MRIWTSDNTFSIRGALVRKRLNCWSHARRDKVFQEIQRPVFSLLDEAPLAEHCTFISYDSVEETAGLKHLAHLSDNVLDEYSEVAE
jgi:hypothetical protein